MSDNIGKRIKERRIALGLSQTELARRAGYADKSGISKIESGDQDLVPAKIERFAECSKKAEISLRSFLRHRSP